MKKSLAIMSIIALTGSVFAQTGKGTFVISGSTALQFIGGNLKFVYNGVTEQKMTHNIISFMPTLGYFVIDNLGIGLVGNITSNVYKYGGIKDVTTSMFILPSALYYVPLEGKIRPLIQAGTGLGSLIEKFGDQKTRSLGLAFNFGGGIAWFLKENISVDAGLTYTLATLKDSDDSKSKTKIGNLGATAGLAFYF